ncbi:Glucitol operon repressor [compost metagenome]
MAATGASIASGLTNSDVLEYEIKKKVVEKAQRVYLLADASKFGRATLLTYSPLNEVDGIVTSQGFPEEYAQYCEENNVAVYVAEE